MGRYIDTSKVTIPEGFFEDLNVPKLLNWLNSQPIADVTEVKHGEWIDDGDCFHCSACGKTYHLGSLQTIYDVKRCWIYCANCGAKNGRRKI